MTQSLKVFEAFAGWFRFGRAAPDDPISEIAGLRYGIQINRHQTQKTVGGRQEAQIFDF
jgi:hypothetical protein